MKSLHDESQPKSFDDWASISNQISGAKLMNLHPGEVFLRLSECGGTIAENVRRDRYHDVFSDLGRCLQSLINMYNRIANDPRFVGLFCQDEFPGLDKFIFERFPRRCPYCGGGHCICAIKFSDSENRTPEERRAMKDEVDKLLETARATEIQPEQLDDFKTLFKSIYGQGHQYMTIDIICFHLLEEIGELAKALSDLISAHSSSLRDLRDELMSEFADIVSWIFALWRKIEYHVKNACRDRSHIKVPEPSEILRIAILG